MRAVVQRVSEGRVEVDGRVIGAIGPGLVILLGVGQSDNQEDAALLAEKVAHLRVFEDEEGKLNRSLLDTAGQALVVSQFTLWGDCRKGRRPSFVEAAPPARAEPLYREFIEELRALGVPTATGRFGALMQLALVNDGPVTLLLDSRKAF
jgi:D-tyrosyl-tRNA(Tyr) deacylase